MSPTRVVRTPMRAEGGVTPEERARMDAITREWIAIAYRTDPIAPELIVPAIKRLYAVSGLAEPRVEIVPSPLALRRAFAEATKTDGSEWWRAYQGGNMWAGFPAYACACRDVLGLRLPVIVDGRWQAWEDCARHGGFRVMLPSVCYVSDFPLRIMRDARNRPHCATGPSHLWRDGWSIYHWHGVRVPAEVIERPHAITAAQVAAESNAEVRRVMVERMGHERYVRESGAARVHSDDFGVLYRTADGQLVVEVVNSTVEPDGSSKRYWLPVHPELRPMRMGENGVIVLGEGGQPLTARNAVASTFGLTGGEYSLAFQS